MITLLISSALIVLLLSAYLLYRTLMRMISIFFFAPINRGDVSKRS